MIVIPAYFEAFAADGGATGVIQIVDSTKFRPGAVGFCSADGLPGVKVIVLARVDATHIRLGLHPDEGMESTKVAHDVSGKRPNLTGYTVAKSARIDIPEQSVFFQPGGGVIQPIPTIW